MAVSVCARCGKRRAPADFSCCGECLCEVIEKRAKRVASAIPALMKGRTGRVFVCCNGSNSLERVSALFVVGKLVHGNAKALAGSCTDAGLIAVHARCADGVAAGFVEELAGKKCKWPGKANRHYGLNIFGQVLEKDLAEYARIKSLKYAAGNDAGKISVPKQKLKAFQEKHPGTMEALANSARKLHR